MIWPAVILGYSLAAVTSRMTRSSLLEVLREDYIRTAWAKGLPERAIVMRHAFRNALLPVLTLSAIQLGTLLGGTVIMETIFTLPGSAVIWWIPYSTEISGGADHHHHHGREICVHQLDCRPALRSDRS